MPTSTLSQVIKRIKAAEDLIVTPVIDRWLIDHPEGVFATTPEMQALLQRLLSDTSNNQRIARIGASARGTCLRQQVFRFLGMPGLRTMDSRLQNVFNDGTWRHVRWQMMGMMAGVFTDVEFKGALPAYNLTTSADARIDDETGFELKGAANYSRVINEGIPEGHWLQMHTMMLVFDWQRFVYVVEDKRTQDTKEIVIRRDPKTISKVKGELNAITDAVEDRKLPPVRSACAQGKGDEYKACPFRKDCPEQNCWPTGQSWGTPVQIGCSNGRPSHVANGTGRRQGRAAGKTATAD